MELVKLPLLESSPKPSSVILTGKVNLAEIVTLASNSIGFRIQITLNSTPLRTAPLKISADFATMLSTLLLEGRDVELSILMKPDQSPMLVITPSSNS